MSRRWRAMSRRLCLSRGRPRRRLAHRAAPVTTAQGQRRLGAPRRVRRVPRLGLRGPLGFHPSARRGGRREVADVPGGRCRALLDRRPRREAGDRLRARPPRLRARRRRLIDQTARALLRCALRLCACVHPRRGRALTETERDGLRRLVERDGATSDITARVHATHRGRDAPDGFTRRARRDHPRT